MQYGKTQQSPIRASVARTLLKVINDRQKLRPYIDRRKGDLVEGEGLLTMDRIREFAKEGYAPFFFQKGIVP
ncbi:MAG: hypothetical protein ACKPKO_59565, partial [Candidatus Fonsibacter sp.]